MKIAIVIDCYEDTGNGTSVSARQFVEQLRNRNVEVVVLCTKCDNRTAETHDNLVTFPVKTIPIFQKTCENQHALLAKPNDKIIREALADVDLVHIYMPFWLGTHCARIAYDMKKPVLGCYHISAENLTFNAGMKHLPFSNSTVYNVLKHIHYKKEWIEDIHCPSRCIAGKILRHHYSQNIHIISNGYDPDFQFVKTEKPNELKNKFVITSVGRLTEEKRQDIIIKAVGKLPNKEEVVLILAGKGPKKDSYVALAEKLKVNLQIVFCSRKELVELLNYSDLFIQASDVETESISCLEAIACGVVPIISNSPMCATKQFALDKRSLFRKGSPASLKRRIAYWMQSPDERKSKRADYAEFAKNYSLEHSIDSILSVYDKILNRKQSNEYCIIDYNNPLTIIVQRNVKGKPLKNYRAVLK